MIRKDSIAAANYSAADGGGARHVFAAVVPRCGGDFALQVRDALGSIDALAREQGIEGSVVRQAVFLHDIRQINACRQMMREFYGSDLPAISYIPQSPCGGELLAIEILAVGPNGKSVEIERKSEHTVIVRHDGAAWVHCANVVPETPADSIYDRSLDAFRRMESELGVWGYRFEEVVRTWLYLGDITGAEAQTTRYQKLNFARTDFYQNRWLPSDRFSDGPSRVAYPASTGIGMDGRDVLVSCLALATDRPDVVRLPLENPRQISAHDYDHRYGAQTPKFSRAMAILNGATSCVLVSGTASILDSESRHVGNVLGQTQETLDNIAALISEDNFRRHGRAGFGATLDDLVLVRVYVKRREDYPAVRDAVRARLGDTPAIYTVADVCRDELLVEIEGIALSSRKNG